MKLHGAGCVLLRNADAKKKGPNDFDGTEQVPIGVVFIQQS
jgi:hypothetical protein